MDNERSEAWKLLNCINYSELTMEELNNLAAVVHAAQKRLANDDLKEEAEEQQRRDEKNELYGIDRILI